MAVIHPTERPCDSCDARSTFDPSSIRTYMKINSTFSFLRKSSLTSGLVLLLGLAQSCSVSESITGNEKNKARLPGKEKEIKVYPDMIKKTMHIKNSEKSEVDFFVFDAQGTLMVHYRMNEKEHKKINGLEKGTYTYQVFK